MQLSEVTQNFFFCSSSFDSSSIAFISRLDLYLLTVEQAHLAFHALVVFSILSVKATLWVIKLFLDPPSILSDSLAQGKKRGITHLVLPLLPLKTCVKIESLPYVQKVRMGYRWHTAWMKESIYFIYNKEVTASVSLHFKRRL